MGGKWRPNIYKRRMLALLCQVTRAGRDQNDTCIIYSSALSSYHVQEVCSDVAKYTFIFAEKEKEAYSHLLSQCALHQPCSEGTGLPVPSWELSVFSKPAAEFDESFGFGWGGGGQTLD